MEQELIIAEILRNKPQGIKLYSPIFGDCTFCYIKDESSDICVRRPYNEVSYFNFDGVYHAGGECLLFPSKEMQDWSKFAWKKGDVLVNENNAHIIFEKFTNDTYTTFIGRHYFNKNYLNYIPERCTRVTQHFHIEEGDAVQTYISNVEKEIGGKLNLKTLEVEKGLLEFKDGDVIVTADVPSLCYSKCIFILKGDLYAKDNKVHSYAFYNINNKHISFNVVDTFIRDRKIRLATDSEKLQLFDMLTMKGKYWDAANKQIMDIKPDIKLKPFDKVLVRDCDSDCWRANLYGYVDKDACYHCVYANWLYCIPYEGNEHLLGTKNNPK